MNNSLNVSVAQVQVHSVIVYAVEGTVIVLVNLPLVLSVLIYRSLREQKEFVMYAGLCLGNGLFGAAYATGNCYRLFKTITNSSKGV